MTGLLAGGGAGAGAGGGAGGVFLWHPAAITNTSVAAETAMALLLIIL